MKAAKVWFAYRQLNSSKPKRICKGAKKLGRLKQKKAVLQLVGLLQHADPSVRAAVAAALGEIGDPQAVTPLVVALGDKEEACFEAARDSLREFGKPAVLQLIAMARADEDRLRAGVMATLGRMNDASTVDVLLSGLSDRAPVVRAAAAEGLGRSKDERAVMPLVSSLQDERQECRLAAQEALVNFGTLAGRHLIGMISHQNETMREGAIRTLGALKDYSAVGPLTMLMDDPSPKIQKTATIAVGRIGEASVVSRLRSYLDDEDRDFRNEAFSALEGLSRSGVSNRDWYVVRECGGAAVRPIVEAIFTQLSDLAEQKKHDPAALLWVDDALNAIVEIGETKSIPFLLKLMAEPLVSSQSLIALEKWLKRSSLEFTEDHLREISGLDEVVAKFPLFDGKGTVEEKKCDCSAVNQLAQQALRERSEGHRPSVRQDPQPPDPPPTPARPVDPSPAATSARPNERPAAQPPKNTITIDADFKIEFPADAVQCGVCERPIRSNSSGNGSVILADHCVEDDDFMRGVQKTLCLLERFECASCGKDFCWQCAVEHVHDAGVPSPGEATEWCPGCAAKVPVGVSHRDKAERLLSKPQRKQVIQVLGEAHSDALPPDANAFEVGSRLAALGWNGSDAYFGRLYAWQAAKLIEKRKTTLGDLLARIA